MLKYLLILILPICSFGQSELERYYSGDTTLSKDRILELSNDNIFNGLGYQKALGHYYLGYYSYKSKDYISAWENFTRGINYYNNSDTTDYVFTYASFTYLGLIAKKLGLYDISSENYEIALKSAIECDERSDGNYINHNSTSNYVRSNLGRSYKQLGLHDKALRIFSEIDRTSESGSRLKIKANRELGLLHLANGLDDEADGYFQIAIDQSLSKSDGSVSNKSKMWIYHDWANVYYKKKNFKRQEELLNKALELHVNFMTMMDLGECLMLQGRDDEAVVMLKKAESIYYTQDVNIDNIKVFGFLRELTGDSKYSDIRADEYQKFVHEQLDVKREMSTLAFRNAINEIKNKIVFENTIRQLKNGLKLSGVAGCIVLLIILTFRFVKRSKRRKLTAESDQLV
ncbi:tetratricopeptide repeat protein [Ekhidna sp.]